MSENEVPGFFGPFPNFSAAQDASSDFHDEAAILRRVVEAARKVERGEGAFERDSVVFETPECRWPVLACVLHALMSSKVDSMVVVDFGGALGSFYRQHKKFLKYSGLSWAVVEQEHYVKAGKEFEDGTLKFYPSLEAVMQEHGRIDLVLLGGVLPYLNEIDEFLRDLAKLANAIVVSRSWSGESSCDQYFVHQVPEEIYSASAPFRLLGKGRLEIALTPCGFTRFVEEDEAENIMIGDKLYSSILEYWVRKMD